MDHLQHIFCKLHDAEVTMKFSKCHFFAKEIMYLGQVLRTTGIKPLPSKTAAIKLMNLGPVGYYCKFMKNVACIAKPLTSLTYHDAKFAWKQSFHSIQYPQKHFIRSTYSSLPRPFQALYSVCRCFR